MKVQACKIELHRAEGLVEECVPVTIQIGDRPSLPRFAGHGVVKDPQHLWLVAQLILGELGLTAPTSEEGGYDKTDFTVTWEDGETYKGRFDLQRGGVNDDGDCLWEQVGQFLGFLAGTYRPGWMDDEQWQTFQRESSLERRESARQFLAEYQIGPLVP